MTSYVEIIGRVTTVTFSKNSGDLTEFRVKCVRDDRTFAILSSFDCPVRCGDIVHAMCVEFNARHTLVRLPFVHMSKEKESILRCIIKSLRCSYNVAAKIYDQISSINSDVVKLLDEQSQKWNKERHSELLLIVDELSVDDVDTLCKWWYRERVLRSLKLFGLTVTEIESSRMEALTIYEHCLSNPFVIPSISLEKAVNVMAILGRKPDQQMIKCGTFLRYLWAMLTDNGWVATPSWIISKQFPDVSTYIECLKQEYNVIVDLECAYVKLAHEEECRVASWIERQRRLDLDNSKTIELLPNILSEDQVLAVRLSLVANICIITGGAGTGKTTVLANVVRNLIALGVDYLLCSFTGKAVARIREVLISAKLPTTNTSTINMAIVNARKCRPFAHLLIDEASMIPLSLFATFLLAYPHPFSLTLIGDDNQLRPIDYGDFFSQLLRSRTIPTVRLTINHRSYTVDGEVDGVILNGRLIVEHKSKEFAERFEFIESGNFSLVPGNEEQVRTVLAACFKSGLTIDDIAIVTPYDASAKQLNKIFQGIFNVNNRSVTDRRGVTWSVRDRVMLKKNDYGINVFNGESGVIIDVTPVAILVDFGSGQHQFMLDSTFNHRGDGTRKEERTVLQLDHSFALTIDKSQGSEWNFVIVYVPSGTAQQLAAKFIYRGRIYTAITRAKRCVWVIGDIDRICAAINKEPSFRCDNLAKRLSSLPVINTEDDGYPSYEPQD